MFYNMIWIYLLLFCIESGLVHSQGRTCDFPDLPANSELKSPVDADHVFSDGDSVKYKCKDGFLIGGNIVRTCQDSIWTEVRFTCDEITCRYTAPPENGYIKDVTYDVGTFVVFGCNDGFKLKGTSRILCGIDGEWRSQARPKCTPVMCPQLYDIHHGEIFQDSSDGLRDNYESVAEYTCTRGYRVFGTEMKYRRTCQLNGKWSGPEPYCEAPTCDEITPLSGREIYYSDDKRIEHSFAFYACDDGYTMSTSTSTVKSQCTEMLGEYGWLPRPPACHKKLSVVVPANCSTRSRSPEITHLQSYYLSPKSRYEFYSSEDYLTNNNLKITNIKGQYAPPLPECVPERCSTRTLSETHVHVYYKNNTRASGKIDSHVDYSFACTSKYEFAGHRGTLNLIRRCEFGRFINVPKCVPKQCVINNIQLQSNQIRIDHNSQVNVKCKSKNLELFSNSSWSYKDPFSTRCSYGQFSKPVNSLVCVPKRCNTETLENTNIYLNGEQQFGFVESNFTYTVECIKGYELKDDRYLDSISVERRCVYGEFLNIPKCVEKRCSWTNKEIELVYHNKSPVMSEKVSHNRQVNVRCPSDRPQIFNTMTGNYPQKIRTQCQHGYFTRDVNSFKCVQKPCDTKVLSHTNVHLANGARVKGLLQAGVTYKLMCEDKYVFQDFPDKGYKESQCVDGKFSNVSKCIGKPCTLLYSDENIQILPDDNGLTNGSIIPDNTQVSATCKADYELFDQDLDKFRAVDVTVTCNLGHMDKLPICAEKRCRIDGPIDGHCYRRKQTQGQCLGSFSVRSTKTIYLQCRDKYSLTQFDGNGSADINDTGGMVCTRGRLSPRYRCEPDPCTIPDLSNASTNITSNSIKSRETISFTCDEGHHLAGSMNDIHWSGQCNSGIIKNIPAGCVPDNCNKPNGVNGQITLVSSQEPLTDVIQHGTAIQLVCDHGFDVVSSTNEIANNTQPQMQCDRGVLLDQHQCKRCRNGRFPEAAANNTVNDGLDTSTQSPSSKNMTCDEYTIKPDTDCTLLKSSIYNYTDSNGIDIILPQKVNEGTNIMVTCKYLAEYDYYSFNDYYSAGNETITCKNGSFTDVSIYCKDSSETTAVEKQPNPCEQFVLKNGIVTHNELGEYYVICDVGYSLNLPQQGRDRPCTCSEKELICFAGKKPKCEADTCDIPLDMDNQLTIYQMPNRVYLSAGDKIDHESDVFFNCSNINIISHKYEPANRKFQCKFGRWREADRNLKWNFGNNGTFPTCRKAICKPPCDNGGVCFRDGQCQCQHMTKGNRCQIPVCDEKCTTNGGTCLKPGKCGNCPTLRYGDNCELKNTCLLPQDAARHETNRDIYSAGETIYKQNMTCDRGQVLSSAKFMTCQHNRTWTNIIKCHKTNLKYLVRIQVADWYNAPTRDTVYVRIDGYDDISTEYFTMNGNFGRNKLVENAFHGIDVRPIQRVVVKKDSGPLVDDNVRIEYASIYIEGTDDYYVFSKQNQAFWLNANTPTPLYISGHPEHCVHTYGSALNRSPISRGNHVLFGSLRECKQRCATTLSMTCRSIYYMPSQNDRRFGHCYHYSYSPDDNRFKDNRHEATRRGFVSYKRTCRQQP